MMKFKSSRLVKNIAMGILLCGIGNIAEAQNVGIGIASPGNKLEIGGNLVVKSGTLSTQQPPTAAQTRTLTNGTINYITIADSVCRMYDPGGPTGNYVANLSANGYFYPDMTVYGYEVQIEEIQLGTGDSLIFSNNSSRILAVGNNYSSPGNVVFQSSALNIQFKSNGDASVGSGFALLIKRIYLDPSLPALTQSSQVGNSLSFDVKNGALRAGTGNLGTIGNLSVALGKNNIAEGLYSVAVGNSNASKGQSAFTLGENNNANGYNTLVFGNNNSYQGGNGLVAGNSNTGYGVGSTIIGSDNQVTNDSYSFVAGNNNNLHNGLQSTLIGNYLSGIGSYATALGFINKVPATLYDPQYWDVRDPLFAIGNGVSGPSNALMILKSGNTGIGIDAPAATLHVKEKMILDQPATSGLASIEWRSNNSYRGGLGFDHSADRFFFFDGESGQNVFFINNGRFGIRRDASTNALEVGGDASKSTAGSWLGNSDARLKKNIIPVTNALEKLLQLKGVQYEWNDHQTGYPRPTGMQMGFTAQNVQEVFPEKVSTDAQGFLQTAYGTYDPLLVEAIRELTKKVEALELKIKLLQENNTGQ